LYPYSGGRSPYDGGGELYVDVLAVVVLTVLSLSLLLVVQNVVGVLVRLPGRVLESAVMVDVLDDSVLLVDGVVSESVEKE
jgi:hypothetical protein